MRLNLNKVTRRRLIKELMHKYAKLGNYLIISNLIIKKLVSKYILNYMNVVEDD